MGWHDTQLLTPESVERERLARQGLRADDSATVLVWVLGGMALLMGVAGFGLILMYYWDVLGSLLRVLSLGGLMVLIWLGYAVSARFGWSSREVLGLFLSFSWLLIVLGLSELLPGLPPWLLGLVFLGGAILVPVLLPARSTVTVLAVSCLVEMALLWMHVRNSNQSSDWAMLWTGILSVLMMWAAVGNWCDVTLRRGYATFSVLGSISSFLYMFAYQGMLLYPQYLRPASLQGDTDALQWVCMMLVWMIPMGFQLLVHCMRSRRRHHSIFTYSFLLYYGATVCSLPLALLLLERNIPVAGVAVMFGYAACIVFYGVEYRMPRYVFFSCMMAFLTAIAIPLGLGADMLWSACVMLALCVIFLISSLALSKHRDNVFRRAGERRERLMLAMSGNTVRPDAPSPGGERQASDQMVSVSLDAGAVTARTVPLSAGAGDLSRISFGSDDEDEGAPVVPSAPTISALPDSGAVFRISESQPRPDAFAAPLVPSRPSAGEGVPLRVPPLPESYALSQTNAPGAPQVPSLPTFGSAADHAPDAPRTPGAARVPLRSDADEAE